ncbi:MAG: hypothetical protein NT037_18200 [Hyphomicrobiales bacterium]|nr:hypothetical protein [Hyphomicrobiales bacterium]
MAAPISTTQVDATEDASATLDIQIAGVTGVILPATGRSSVTLTIPPGFSGAPALRLAPSGAGSVSFRRMKLEFGASMTAWVSRPLTHEQLSAQRYFFRINGPRGLFLYAQGLGNYFFNGVLLPVPMRVTPVVSRIVSASGNLFQNDVANASAAALGPGSLRLSISPNAASECYANFDRVDCSAEL